MRKHKTALITGITGQDGSYLAELLLEKGYGVHGLIRRVSIGYGNFRNISHLLDKITLHRGDMGDSSSIHRVVSEVRPDELYNLAAQADVGDSFDMGEYSVDINGIGVYRVLSAVKQHAPQCRVYQASTSELFGAAEETPQNERTQMNPQSPYSIGKLVGYHAIRKARDAGLFACNGILFNHESERRGDDYLTRKVTKAVARIKHGLQSELRLGNLESKRDWGYSPEYVEAAWRILQQDIPDDFVVGTGETHTVEEWVREVFALAGLDWKQYVVQDEHFFRPAEVDILLADATKTKKVLGWEPKVTFTKLAKIMYEHDLKQESPQGAEAR
jgi:GDPmannose 4,6-dehydratase